MKRYFENWLLLLSKRWRPGYLQIFLQQLLLSGHPLKYWAGSSLFNFDDLEGTGALSVTWP